MRVTWELSEARGGTMVAWSRVNVGGLFDYADAHGDGGNQIGVDTESSAGIGWVGPGRGRT